MLRAITIATLVTTGPILTFAEEGPLRNSKAVASLNVAIREWDLPAPGSLPHDPAVGGDGSLWYTAQKANRVGRLDPTTGKITEYKLPTPDSGPHGLVADRAGNIWYTGNHAGLIGKVDVSTGHVTEYRIADKRAQDPHTPVFDQNGVLWFTVQRGNMVGRLDPATGKIELREVPTPNAIPYGLAINRDGVPIFCEFGTNKIGSVDPRTFTIREYTLTSGARPRRLAIAADGSIYYSDYGRGTWATSTRRPAGSKSGHHPEGNIRSRTASRSRRTAWFGTASRGSSRIRSCASIREIGRSLDPPSPPAAASFATSLLLKVEGCTSRAAA